MRNKLLIYVLFVFAFTKAQDSSFCYNGGVIASQTGGSLVVSVNNNLAHSLILMPCVMNEKEVVKILRERKSSSVDKLLSRVELSKKLRLVGLAAIPAGIIGAINIAEAGKNNPMHNVGLGFAALSAVSLSSCFYFNHERKKNYKKAIAKYNQLYN